MTEILSIRVLPTGNFHNPTHDGGTRDPPLETGLLSVNFDYLGSMNNDKIKED